MKNCRVFPDRGRDPRANGRGIPHLPVSGKTPRAFWAAARTRALRFSLKKAEGDGKIRKKQLVFDHEKEALP